MANYQRFEDLIAWQKAKTLTITVYKTLTSCRDFGYRDQVQRAAVSVMNNIAEGFERGTPKEYQHFLYIAKGSCGEVRSMLLLGAELGYIPEEKYLVLKSLSEETAKVLAGLIKSI